MVDTSSKVLLNFSDEEFIPCRDGIFIKRLSKSRDDDFSEDLYECLKRANYDGVCYIGLKRGKVLEEHINQDVWEKSVENSVENFIFWISGSDTSISDQFVKDEILYIERIKSYSRKKYMFFNSSSKEYNSLEDFNTLEGLVNITVSKIKQRRENGR